MKNNQFLIILSIIIITIFGGIFAIRYFRNGEILLDQLAIAFTGIILLLGSIVWRRKHIVTKD